MSSPVVQAGGPANAESVRTRAFCALLVAFAVFGGLVVSFPGAELLASLVLAPFYMLWVYTDLRVRNVVGSRALVQFLVAGIPGLGILFYFVWSRGVGGVVQCLAFLIALWIPALLVGGVVAGFAGFASGEGW
ncbi:MAG: hypothetical protein VYE77_06185 [Planctomycetota bacterium]|nr:hypothetical protein [Planctomycetota bacterium]